ncbi:MAG: ATP-binding protein [Candidatus Binatia bacterium]
MFVGRKAEMAELHAAVSAALCGRGQLVLMAGEPGIGKTRLADAAVVVALGRIDARGNAPTGDVRRSSPNPYTSRPA